MAARPYKYLQVDTFARGQYGSVNLSEKEHNYKEPWQAYKNPDGSWRFHNAMFGGYLAVAEDGVAYRKSWKNHKPIFPSMRFRLIEVD